MEVLALRDMVPPPVVHVHQASMGQTVPMTSITVHQLPVKMEAPVMMDMVPPPFVHAYQASMEQTVLMTSTIVLQPLV